MTTQQIIGENLTELREQQGLTRGDIAAGVSVTNQTVAAWEWGTRCPSVDLLMKICELLSVTPNDLVYNDLVYEESSRVSSREKKEPVLRVQKDNVHRTAVGRMPVLQHRSPLQGKYKEVQPLLPLLRAGFAVVKEE